MATYSAVQLEKNDSIATPIEVWNDIKKYIPLDKKIWCPFFFKGELTLKKITNNIIHSDKDFYKWKPDEYDIIIDNPPFRPMPKILERLFELDKPFMILCPISKLRTKYMKKNIKDKKDITILYPSYRLWYINPNKNDKKFKSATFETIVLCYKMGFEKENIWI